MKAGRVALTVTQGTTFRRRFVWKSGPAAARVGRDLTGWAARATFRVGDRRVMQLSTEDGTILLTAAGEITLSVPIERTLAAAPGSGTWGLDVISPDGDRDTLLLGPLTVMTQVGGG